MASKKRKRSSASGRSGGAASRPRQPACTAVREIDQAPFLKKAVTECRRLRTELGKKRDRLREFEESDKPAYQQWLHATFGRELTELRELRAEAEAMHFIVQNLEYCEWMMPHKLEDVRAELFRRKEEGTLHAFEPPPSEREGEGSGERGGAADAANEESDEEAWEKDLRQAFEKAFRDAFDDDADDDGEEQGFGGFFRRFFGGGQDGSEREAVDPALKSVYRSLAKRLHPDRSDLEESVREQRWHELQEAYENRDIDAMRRIEAVCDMDRTGISLKLGLARLRELAAYHRSHLKPIRDALKEAKKHPAFHFRERGEEKLRHRVQDDLAQTRADLAFEVKDLKARANEFVEDEEEADFEDDGWDPFANLFPEPRGWGGGERSGG